MVEGDAKRRAAALVALALALGALGAPSADAAVSHPLRSVNPAGLRQGKDSAHRQALRSGALGARPRAARPRTAVFAGLNLPGLTDPSGSPPDTTGAIGPGHYVEFVNSQVGVYGRDTLASVSQTPLATFVGTGADVCDPQIQWDPPGRTVVLRGPELRCRPLAQPALPRLVARPPIPATYGAPGRASSPAPPARCSTGSPSSATTTSTCWWAPTVWSAPPTSWTAVILWSPSPRRGPPPARARCPRPPSSAPRRARCARPTATSCPRRAREHRRGSATGYVVAADDPTVAPFTATS